MNDAIDTLQLRITKLENAFSRYTREGGDLTSKVAFDNRRRVMECNTAIELLVLHEGDSTKPNT